MEMKNKLQEKINRLIEKYQKSKDESTIEIQKKLMPKNDNDSMILSDDLHYWMAKRDYSHFAIVDLMGLLIITNGD